MLLVPQASAALVVEPTVVVLAKTLCSLQTSLIILFGTLTTCPLCYAACDRVLSVQHQYYVDYPM